MDKALITIENLFKNYTGTQAVRGISLDIFNGEFFGLLGPNGAGKTTTIAMLTGLTNPSRGRILINGVSISSDPLRVKSLMGFVPQEFAFYPTLNAVDNLRFFGRLYGLRGPRLKRRILDVLVTAGLQDWGDKVVATFSNGMMRRLNIAIGLVHDPPILILDEPTVGVDAHSRNAIYETLERLNRQGVTVLYTTHHMEEAQQLCRRIAIMDYGKILAVDTPQELIRAFGEGLVRIEFQEPAEENMRKQMAQLETVNEVGGRGRHWYIKARKPEKAVRSLMALAEARDVRFRTLNILEANLESVFLHLTGRLRDSSGTDKQQE